MVNYLKQIMDFKRKRLQEPLSPNAICLYYILLEYANELRFPHSFTATNGVIGSLCGFSLSTLDRRRAELCDKGYITYTENDKGKCGTYTITSLSPHIWRKSDMESDMESDIGSDEEVTALNKYKYKYKDKDKERYIYNARTCAPDSSDPKPKKMYFRLEGCENDS